MFFEYPRKPSGYGHELVTSVSRVQVLEPLKAQRVEVEDAWWIVRSVPLEIVGSNGHEKVPKRAKPVWSNQEDHEEKGSKDRAASTYGPHSDSFNDTSRHSSMANTLPRFVPCTARWGSELKRQMSSCHSVHDLELAVQDLWAHLPKDNIRCLINSMPDRVVACIAAGGGPKRY
ncbi:transposable element Tcb2 transposase [Trichonephila clavipes]|nr:transposable element Tcb2 transposase [Trichonephila clavipes]